MGCPVNNITLSPTTLRSIATVIITGLSGAFAYYPNQLWIPAVIAGAATVGIHAIPAIGQVSGLTQAIRLAQQTPGKPPVSLPSSSETLLHQEPVYLPNTPPVAPTGAQLMGITRPENQ